LGFFTFVLECIVSLPYIEEEVQRLPEFFHLKNSNEKKIALDTLEYTLPSRISLPLYFFGITMICKVIFLIF